MARRNLRLSPEETKRACIIYFLGYSITKGVTIHLERKVWGANTYRMSRRSNRFEEIITILSLSFNTSPVLRDILFHISRSRFFANGDPIISGQLWIIQFNCSNESSMADRIATLSKSVIPFEEWSFFRENLNFFKRNIIGYIYIYKNWSILEKEKKLFFFSAKSFIHRCGILTENSAATNH